MAAFRLIWFATAVLVLTGNVWAKSLASYKLGDTAAEDLVAPVELTVVDLEATQALKKKVEEQGASVFYFHTNAIHEAQKDLLASMANTRSNFVEAFKESGQYPSKPEYFPLPGFDRFVALFQETNDQFPVSLHLAKLWGKDQSDDLLTESMEARLREAMEAPIRRDSEEPALAPKGPVRLVPVGESNETVTAQIIEERGTEINGSKVQTLTEAKKALAGSLGGNRDLENYLATFLRPNCLAEAERAGEGPVLVADHYKVGEVILKRGEVVDKKAARALQQLDLQAQAKESPTNAIPNAGNKQARAAAGAPSKRVMLAIIGGGTGVMILVILVWRFMQQRQVAAVAKAGEAGTDNLVGQPLQTKPASGLMARMANLLPKKIAKQEISQPIDNSLLSLEASLEKAAERSEQPRSRLATEANQDQLFEYERQIAFLEKKLVGATEVKQAQLKIEIEAFRQAVEEERAKSGPS